MDEKNLVKRLKDGDEQAFNEMVDKLGNNELLARDFVSNVSHQFKTPISSIHGYAQLLESNDLTDEERNEYIKIIKEKSIALSELINDILVLSRLEHTSMAIPTGICSLMANPLGRLLP